MAQEILNAEQKVTAHCDWQNCSGDTDSLELPSEPMPLLLIILLPAWGWRWNLLTSENHLRMTDNTDSKLIHNVILTKGRALLA